MGVWGEGDVALAERQMIASANYVTAPVALRAGRTGHALAAARSTGQDHRAAARLPRPRVRARGRLVSASGR